MKFSTIILLIILMSLFSIPLSADENGIHTTGISTGSLSDEELLRYAMEAQNYSYSPYSHFKVGAALLTVNGTVYTGTNVENAAYGPTMGAEQVAVFKAVSEGDQKFSAIAITSSGGDFAYPGGSQRQVLAEFGLDTRVIVTNGTDIKTTTVRDLLPHAFGPEDLIS